jgi:hypothetical protein
MTEVTGFPKPALNALSGDRCSVSYLSVVLVPQTPMPATGMLRVRVMRTTSTMAEKLPKLWE